MIDAYATEAHFLHHLLPIWKALPAEQRGTLYVAPGLEKETRFKTARGHVPSSDVPIVVASSGDLRRVQDRRRVALAEHGCGISYGGDKRSLRSASYAGGDRRDGAELFLHPGPIPAARDRERYPRARVEVVGSPRLDSLPKRGKGPLTVAVSFHWNATVSPEAQGTFIFYREHLKILAKKVAKTGEFELIGHGHPRHYDRIRKWYDRQGIEAVESFDEVCRRADLYVVDNSSTLYEFAATGRQVIVLNSPLYRRSVKHGIRFWDAIPGPQVDEPSRLLEAIRYELAHPTLWTARREAALDKVYAYRTGAAKRAADVLIEWASGSSGPTESAPAGEDDERVVEPETEALVGSGDEARTISS